MAVNNIGSIAYVGSDNGFSKTGSSFTLSPSAVDGDLLIVVSAAYDRSAGVASVSSDGTGSWTEIVNDSDSTNRLRINWKIRNGDTTITVAGSGTSGDGSAGVLRIFRNVNSVPIDVAITKASGNSTNPNAAAVTPVTTGATVLIAAESTNEDTNPGTPSGWAGLVNATSGGATLKVTVSTTYLLPTPPASPPTLTDPPNWTSWDTGLWQAITVALRPAGYPVSLVNTAPVLDAPALGQKYALVASFTNSAPVLNAPALKKVLAAANLTNTAPVLAALPLVQQHALLPNGFVNTQPSLPSFLLGGAPTELNLGDYALDNGLNAFLDCDRIYICYDDPAGSFDNVLSYALGDKDFGADNVFGAVSDGSPIGRKVTSAAVTDGVVTDDGLAGYWAAVDYANSRFLASAKLKGDMTVLTNQKFTLDSITIHTFGTA